MVTCGAEQEYKEGRCWTTGMGPVVAARLQTHPAKTRMATDGPLLRHVLCAICRNYNHAPPPFLHIPSTCPPVCLHNPGPRHVLLLALRNLPTPHLLLWVLRSSC